MAASARREEFDRDRDFTVAKAMLWGGVKLQPGQQFDNSTASTRRLRQLYESRYLRMEPVGSAKTIVGPDGTIHHVPAFGTMKEAEVRAWLKENGAEASERAPLDRLVNRAQRRFKQIVDGDTKPVVSIGAIDEKQLNPNTTSEPVPEAVVLGVDEADKFEPETSPEPQPEPVIADQAPEPVVEQAKPVTKDKVDAVVPRKPSKGSSSPRVQRPTLQRPPAAGKRNNRGHLRKPR